MKKLVIKKKTGFAVHEGPVEVLDFRKKMFYDTSELPKPVEKFNLPRGVFYLRTGSIIPMKKPIRYNLPRLPRRERFGYMNPANFKVLFAPNPNRATVNWTRQTITFDTSLRNASLTEIMFILFHEFGHKLYTAENLADLYAVRELLLRGYNPSQIGMAPLRTLSAKQFMRKKYVVDTLTSSRT